MLPAPVVPGSDGAVSALAVRDVREGGRWGAGQRLKNDAVYLAIRVSLAIAAWMPRGVTRLACAAVARRACALRGAARRRAATRLAAGLGRAPERAEVRACFLGAGAVLADTLTLLDPAERAATSMAIDPASRRLFQEALAEGRGVIYLTAHLGPWERMAACLVEEGFPVATLARESYDPRLTRLYERLRRPRGVRAIYRGDAGAALAIARELRAGRAVGFLVDLPGRVPCVDAALWGARARLPIGPARIALRPGSAVLVGTPRPPAAAREGSPEETAGGRWSIAIARVPIDDLARGPEGEQALLERAAGELSRRLDEGAWPAWLGLFAPDKAR